MKNKVVFVLLAGGKSARMGVAKGLLPYNNSFWILEQINRIAKSTLSDVYIGLGFHHERYFEAIPWLTAAQHDFVTYRGIRVRVVLNKNPETGSFSTCQTVLKEIPLQSTILLNPIDIPILNPVDLQRIINTKNDIVQPNFEGKNGHPIQLSSFFWNNLVLQNPLNTRLDLEIKKLDPSQITTIAVADSLITQNINTSADWISFLAFDEK
ncbi:nucleotidyltransferase family protein [Flavobacterium restrictum]|uniref:MobA-like NTP transferase domain-containing protein n=1 Tax=Flavobacterium restrictum TaxID=2594428 RepID=A0A553E2L2_9FLAO|nr:NTP transferase domain-containing protein [Flavobacterium restrictum]TRX39287.1 hypothetical protein FNW21_10165 [Flavobacterium restrictum]